MNGVNKTATLSEAHVAQLQKILEPLVAHFKNCQILVAGFLMGAGILHEGFNIDISTGIVTLLSTPGPELASPASEELVTPRRSISWPRGGLHDIR